MREDFTVAEATAADWDEVVSWTEAEGWNPGHGDAACFRPTDPAGFLVGRLDGRIVSACSVVAYSPDYAFLGYYLVHPDRKVSDFTITNGEEAHVLPITLAHIMSGAMLVGLVERAKANAFHRDLASNTRTGIQRDDLFAAVDQLVRENTGLQHSFAAQEILEAFLAKRQEEQRRMMN